MVSPENVSQSGGGDNRKRVLIVDDAESVRDVLSVALERAGYAVSLAADGISALHLLRRCKVDIVVTDWEMPEMNGKELCLRIREMTPDWYVYTILMTAHSQKVGLIDALRTGADEYVTKPLKLNELVARLDAAARLLDMVRHLRMQASHDPLTGVLNRKTILEIVEREHARSLRYSTPLSALVVDIDDFAGINEDHGRNLGDQVLRTVAQLTRQLLRHCDYVGRYGDDKLLVLLAEACEFDAAACAKRLCHSINQLDVVGEDQPVNITVSIGVSESSAILSESTDLINRAVQALSTAKNNGRNRVETWRTSVDAGEPATCG